MSEKVGIIAFESGKSDQRSELNAGPGNFGASITARRIRLIELSRGNIPLLAAQGEAGANIPVSIIDLRVETGDAKLHTDDIETMYDASIAFFKKHGVKRIILVGHPTLLFFVNYFVVNSNWEGDGVTVDHQYDALMKDIPYDKSDGNKQWWMKNSLAFVLHTADALVIRTFAPIVDAIKAILPWKSS